MSNETMSPAELMSDLKSLGWPDPYDRDVPAGPATFKKMHAAVAALIEREAALAERVKALVSGAEALCDALTEGAPGDDLRAYDELRRLLRAEARNV